MTRSHQRAAEISARVPSPQRSARKDEGLSAARGVHADGPPGGRRAGRGRGRGGIGTSKVRVRTILRLLSGILLCGVLLAGGAGAAERVYIDIDSPNFQKFPLAVADFYALSPGPEGAELSRELARSLSEMLEITRYVHLIPPEAFLEDPARADSTLRGTHFPDWRAVGAEYLVKGAYQVRGRNLTVDFRLFDVVRGEIVRDRRFTGTLAERKDMVRKFAGEILFALTGEGGVFDTKIAFVLKTGRQGEIHTVNFDGSGLSRLTQWHSLTLSPRWSPGGRYLTYTSYRDGNPDLYVQSYPGGAAKKIAAFPGLNLAGPWSPDGKRLLLTLSRDGNQEIYAMSLEDGRLQRLTYNAAIDVSPAWSPDGRRIAFVSNRSGSPQIYIMDREGGDVRRLTFDGGYNTSPAWSPKGDRIAYEGRVNGNFQIHTIREDGSEPTLLTTDPGDHESPSWSPDGRYLAFSVRGGAKGQVCVMNANGTGRRVLVEAEGCLTPAWSPRLR